jgi:lipopolysaccharide biosynthesis glycosyltransferase
MTSITHPILKEYAKRCNADFRLIEGDPPVITDDGHPHWRIANLYNYYDEYDRILCIDSDVLVLPNCPNLFDEVPEKCIGSSFEDIGSRAGPRRQSIQNIQKQFGDIGWKQGYINTGVLVTSKMHRDVFTSVDGRWYTNFGSDDVHIGYKAFKLNFKIHQLSYKFNHMTMFSEPWNNNADRFESYIIHYAGRGQFNLRLDRISNIREDAKRIEELYENSK